MIRCNFAYVPLLVLGLFLAGAIPGDAQAQDFQRVAPKELPAPTPVPTVTPPPLPATSPDDQKKRVIIPELLEIKLVDGMGKFMLRGASGTGIVIDGLPILEAPALRASLTAFLNKPLTFGDLDDISRTVVAWYRAHDRPYVDVAFPEQDVTAGVLQAVVTEFRAGKVTVKGNEWFSSDLLRDQIRLQTGQPISEQDLNADLAWLSQNPFRTVTMVAEKSDTVGAVDFSLNTQDRLPLRVYVGYDDTGTPILGLDRWNLGVNWGNAFGLDQQLSYQLSTSDDFWSNPSHPTFVAHSINWVAPLPWRDKISIFGSFSQVVPLLGPDLGLTGTNGQASLRYIVTLPTMDASKFVPGLQSLTQDLQIGYDFKSSNNNLNFGGFQISDVTTEVDQFPIIYDATLASDYGLTTLTNTLVWSPGNLTALNTNTLFEQQANSPFAKSQYIYDNLSIVQATKLPYDGTWIMKLVAQTANHDLLPSEQLGAGGHDSVRGYNERAVNGSLGTLVSEEFRTPSFSLSQPWLPNNLVDQAQLLAFWDYGNVRDVNYLGAFVPGTPNSTEVSSVGLGVRYSISRFVQFRADYGWQLHQLSRATSLGNLLQVGLTVGN